MFQRRIPGALRTERWAREDDAPRLIDEIPELEGIRLDISEQREGRVVPGSRYTKHIVVRGAAALFEVPCGDGDCRDGGHDLTTFILQHLRQRHAEFEGTSACRGYAGQSPCEREVHYVAKASFTPEG